MPGARSALLGPATAAGAVGDGVGAQTQNSPNKHVGGHAQTAK